MEKLYSIREFARANEFTEVQLRNWILRHALPTVRIGYRIFIRNSDYQEWLNNNVRVVG